MFHFSTQTLYKKKTKQINRKAIKMIFLNVKRNKNSIESKLLKISFVRNVKNMRINLQIYSIKIVDKRANHLKTIIWWVFFLFFPKIKFCKTI